MTTRETGLLLFIEEPGSAVARWRQAEIPLAAGKELVAAIHRDLLRNLGGSERVALYLGPTRASDGDYAAALARETGVELLNVPDAGSLQRWDSALSILYNGCGHRKVLCADGHVPEFYAEDVARAQSKLDLYEMVVGREGADRCWLIGMNGYQEVLGVVDVRADDLLHPLLEAAGRVGIKVSVLDTKHALGEEVDLRLLRSLARRPSHRHVRQALEGAGLASPSPARS